MTTSTLKRGLTAAALSLTLLLTAGCASDAEKADEAVAEAQAALDEHAPLYEEANSLRRQAVRDLEDERNRAIDELEEQKRTDRAAAEAEILAPVLAERDAQRARDEEELEAMREENRAWNDVISNRSKFDEGSERRRAIRETEEARAQELSDAFDGRIATQEAALATEQESIELAHETAVEALRADYDQRIAEATAEYDTVIEEHEALETALREAEEHAFTVHLQG